MVQKRMETIYVSAYPKSGSTYLTRLLGDILNSPTGGSTPSQDGNEIATEGQDRPGPYIIRKGHFTFTDSDVLVPSPHRMDCKHLTNEKIVFLVRDPRDICISGAYHWRISPAQFLDRMIAGGVAKCGRWDEYVDGWFDLEYLQMDIAKYERLLSNPFLELDTMFRVLNLEILTRGELYESIQRQSFEVRSKGLDEKEMRRNNMRKGVVGDWRGKFTQQMEDKIWSEFGETMERLGYDF